MARFGDMVAPGTSRRVFAAKAQRNPLEVRLTPSGDEAIELVLRYDTVAQALETILDLQ